MGNFGINNSTRFTYKNAEPILVLHVFTVFWSTALIKSSEIGSARDGNVAAETTWIAEQLQLECCVSDVRLPDSCVSTECVRALA